MTVHVTGIERLFTRPPFTRLPRGSRTPWTDLPLPVGTPDPEGYLTVPNPDVDPEGVPLTFDGEPSSEVGFITATNHTLPQEVSPSVRVTRSETINVTGPGPDVSVIAWYFPPGGVGPGGDSYWVAVDELWITEPQQLLDDTLFVTVAGSDELTNQANTNGWVATESAQVLVAQPSSGELLFAGWVWQGTGISPGYPDGTQLLLDAHASGWAFATYELPPGWKGKLPGPDRFRIPLITDKAAVLAAVLDSQNAGPLGAATARLAANDLIRVAASLLHTDATAEIGKALDADAKQTFAEPPDLG